MDLVLIIVMTIRKPILCTNSYVTSMQEINIMQCSEISARSPSKIQYEVTSALPTSSKRRRLVSEVWNDFNKVEVGGKVRAICKHCCKDFSGSSKSGTTHLKNHLLRCSAIKSGESCKEIISLTKTGDFKNPTVIDGNSVFDEERSGLDVVRMIIKHGYPLNMVEHEYFKVFVKNLQPMFKLHSHDTLKAGILHVYREEKEKLCKHLGMLSCCFSLILNFWTCDGKKNKYCCFTLQFIEDGLKLKKKILAVKNLGYNYTGETLFGIVKSLLLEWNIDKKLCSITVESSSSNDQMVKTLESWLGNQGYHPFRGILFHIRCITHIINLLVQDGLDEIDDILHKIRKAIKYISGTTIGKEKFQEVVKKLNLQSKDITSQGVPIRWDSTFFMLESALEFREAFSYLQSSDFDFPLNLSMEEWDKAKVMHKCLIVFYDGICSFLGSKCLTTNVYFRKICDIHHNLIQWQKSEHAFIRSVAKKMSETFDNYFDYCTSVSAIAAVFDPRTKLDFVHYSFTELYGGHAKKYLLIDDALGHIFDEYAEGRSSQASTSYDDNNSDILDRWYKSKRDMNKAHSQRAELHRYLEEPIADFEGEFDILGWWHTNSTKFPTLWRIARDILAIPMSTSISNSAFSIETMTISPTFNGLDPDIIEALVCGEDWLDNPVRITANKDNDHSFEPTHTSFGLAGTSLSLESQEKHAPSTTNTKLMLANLSSTWSPQPFPTGVIIKSSDHGSSGNIDAEAVKSCIRTMEFEYHDKVVKEMERAEYEAQLAAKEAQNRQDREQYAQEKFELEQRIKHLEVEWQKLLLESSRDRHRNVLVPPNYGYPAPASTPSSSSQLGVSNPRGSWHEGEGSYHHLDTTSDISHCPDLLYNSQNQGTSSLVTMDLVRVNEFLTSPVTPPPTTPPGPPEMDQDFYQHLAAYDSRPSMF